MVILPKKQMGIVGGSFGFSQLQYPLKQKTVQKGNEGVRNSNGTTEEQSQWKSLHRWAKYLVDLSCI